MSVPNRIMRCCLDKRYKCKYCKKYFYGDRGNWFCSEECRENYYIKKEEEKKKKKENGEEVRRQCLLKMFECMKKYGQDDIDYFISSGGPYPEEYYRIRPYILKRDNLTCFKCQDNKEPCVHHIDQNKNNNDPNNLITLCSKCHAKLPIHCKAKRPLDMDLIEKLKAEAIKRTKQSNLF